MICNDFNHWIITKNLREAAGEKLSGGLVSQRQGEPASGHAKMMLAASGQPKLANSDRLSNANTFTNASAKTENRTV